MQHTEDGTTDVINGSPYPLPAAFLLEYGPLGARWAPLGSVMANGKASTRLSHQPIRDGEVVVSELRANLQRALVESGLYEDEARAMVRTGSRACLIGANTGWALGVHHACYRR